MYFKSISENKVVIDEIEQTGLEYIQMKLPIENITSEVEAELSDKVEKKSLFFLYYILDTGEYSHAEVFEKRPENLS